MGCPFFFFFFFGWVHTPPSPLIPQSQGRTAFEFILAMLDDYVAPEIADRVKCVGDPEEFVTKKSFVWELSHGAFDVFFELLTTLEAAARSEKSSVSVFAVLVCLRIFTANLQKLNAFGSTCRK